MNSRYALSKKLLFFCILCVIECAAAAKLAAERLLWYDPLGNLSVMPPLWFVCTLFITAAFIDLLPIYVLHWVSITSSTAYWSSLSLASLPSWSTNIVMARFAFFFFFACRSISAAHEGFWLFCLMGFCYSRSLDPPSRLLLWHRLVLHYVHHGPVVAAEGIGYATGCVRWKAGNEQSRMPTFILYFWIRCNYRGDDNAYEKLEFGRDVWNLLLYNWFRCRAVWL